MTRAAALAVALAISLPAAGQIKAPGEWREHTFKFPLPFAPSIPYEGTEYVRFSPYWIDFRAERGFSYAVLWDVKRRALQPQELERGLNVYFDGLMEAATKTRQIKDPGTVSGVSLHPMAKPPDWGEGYSGRVFTWNGFGEGERLVLNAEIAMRDCGADRTQIFFLFSRAARDHAVWKELRDVRTATGC